MEAGTPASPIKRRLTAILAADGVGYSRQMDEDEERILKVLAAQRPCRAEGIRASGPSTGCGTDTAASTNGQYTLGGRMGTRTCTLIVRLDARP